MTKCFPTLIPVCVFTFQADNLIFKDRKLNIGPAVRKQVGIYLFDYFTTKSIEIFGVNICCGPFVACSKLDCFFNLSFWKNASHLAHFCRWFLLLPIHCFRMLCGKKFIVDKNMRSARKLAYSHLESIVLKQILLKTVRIQESVCNCWV